MRSDIFRAQRQIGAKTEKFLVFFSVFSVCRKEAKKSAEVWPFLVKKLKIGKVCLLKCLPLLPFLEGVASEINLL